jgi:hypothetical protein
VAKQNECSRAEDLDMLQAISKFQNQQTGYEAALKSYSMVQRHVAVRVRQVRRRPQRTTRHDVTTRSWARWPSAIRR